MAGFICAKMITNSIGKGLVRSVGKKRHEETKNIIREKLGYDSIDEFMRNATLK